MRVFAAKHPQLLSEVQNSGLFDQSGYLLRVAGIGYE